MDHGRRSFITGNSLLTAVVTGYADAMVSNTKPMVEYTDLYATNSTIFSETAYTANVSDSRSSIYYTNKPTYVWEQPKYVGYWELVPAPSSFRVSTTYKPNWLHRKMTKLFFGWSWHEGKLF